MTLSTLLAVTGLMPLPDDVLKMMIGWFLLAWFSMALGMVIGSLSSVWEPVERMWHVFSYLFLPLSGAFFLVDWLPARVQVMALLVPTVDCTELLREGFFGASIHAHYGLFYVIVVNVVLSFAALLAVSLVSV